jgi:flagellar L-ring protein FlgH
MTEHPVETSKQRRGNTVRYASAESAGWAEQCHNVPSPPAGEGQGGGYDRHSERVLAADQHMLPSAFAFHSTSFMLSASSPPPSLSLPRRGGGNRAALTIATHTLSPQTGRNTLSTRRIRMFLLRLLAATALAALAAACSSIDRLRGVGEQPTLSQINNPMTQTGYKPVQMPMPAPQPASYNPNSLWRNGSRAFFNDQRAHQVGDILTVKVKITDKATLENDTSRSRKNSEDSGVTDFLGSKLIKTPASAILPGKILTADSTASSEGKGSIDRKEELLTNVAGVVTQVLPNGNLVIEGKQEIRVNYEVRELIVAGIVRPEDIESDNTIDSTKIAEARIAYGGRGQITDVQQPRYGQQVLDVLLPF